MSLFFILKTLNEHNLKSRLHESSSTRRISDMVGEERKELLAEIVAELDPFNARRDPVSNFFDKYKDGEKDFDFICQVPPFCS